MPFKNKEERARLGLCSRCSAKADAGFRQCSKCREADRNRPTRKQNKEVYRDWYYTRKYGITLQDFYDMRERQGGKCAICGTDKSRSQPGKSADCLHVDHCHSTGAVRGLLCLSCNRAIGLLKDDPAIAESAANYLRG